MQEENTDLESLIDQALSAYADPASFGEPRVLAAGALRRIEEYRGRRQRWRLVFALGTPALAALLLAVLLLPRASQPRVQQAVATVRPLVVQQPAPIAVAEVSSPKAHIVRVHRRTVVKERRLPKLEQFPAPQPLSKQELLLAAFVKDAPAAMVATIIRQQQNPPGPLQISKLRIPPLMTQ